MKVAFFLLRRPKSLNAKLTNAYRGALYDEALRVSGGNLLSGLLYSRVIWFHRKLSPQGDTDNILKPIHDALKGAAYVDDQAIVRTACFRIDISTDYVLEPDPADVATYQELSDQLEDESNGDLLYIEIGEQPDSTVRLGRFA